MLKICNFIAANLETQKLKLINYDYWYSQRNHARRGSCCVHS